MRSTLLKLAAAAALAVIALTALYGYLETVAAARDDAAPPPATPASGPKSPGVLGVVEGPGSWLVYLTNDVAELPGEAAPVVVIRRDASLQLLRGPHVPTVPEPGPWTATGVVLPATRLAGLDPAQRAALLDVLAALAPPDGLTVGQLAPVGALRGTPAAELSALLRWLR